MVRYLFGGLLGSGKTLIITILGKRLHLKNGYKVYSNYWTSFSEKINPFDLMDFELHNCVTLLDEMDTFYDSRNPRNRGNLLLSYFFKQTRKVDVHVLGTAQLLSAIDLRLRYIADKFFLATAIRQRGEKHPRAFMYAQFNLMGDVVNRKYLRYETASKFFKDFKTEETVSPFLMKKIEFDDVFETYEESPTKKSFVVLMKLDYPTITYDVAGTVYDLLKIDKLERAKKVLQKA